MTDSSSAYLTLSQVAARTGRHPELLRQWCAAGRIPCQRLGGSWVVLEADLALLDRMATRARRRTAAGDGAPSGRRRLLAAVFDDPARAAAGADALRDRLSLDDTQIETAPMGLRSLSGLGLTVVAGQVPEEAVLDARRILVAYAGRIVAELESGPLIAPPPRARSERRRAAATTTP